MAVDKPDENFDRLQKGFESSLDSGEMLTKWYAVMEVMDAEGSRSIYLANSDDTPLWEQEMLLRYALRFVGSKLDFLNDLQIGFTLEESSDDDDE